MFSVKFNLEKSILIDKPISEVFETVSNFASWPTWSPWLIQEPDCPITITNKAGTIGHGQSWQGKDIGSGIIAIKHIQANQQIDYDLCFLKPWKSKSNTSFTFKEIEGQTQITWTMQSTLPIFMFWMKKMMIALIGSDYDRGLSMLKDLCETGLVHSQLDIQKQKSKDEFYYVGIERECSTAQIGYIMSKDLKTLHDLIENNTLEKPINVIAIYKKFDMVNDRCEFVSAITYDKKVEISDKDLSKELITGHVAKHTSCIVSHKGEYKHLGNAWSKAMGYLRGNKIKQAKLIAPYEVYLNDPATTEQKDLITEVNFPLQ